MDIGLGNIFKKRNAVSRSLSAENVSGEKGRGGMARLDDTPTPISAASARDLGQGWKVSPCLSIPRGETVEIMNHEGPGIIRHVWMTLSESLYRNIILRVYWDNQEAPSVECPIGDFFCQSWNQSKDIMALPINVNPTGGMNCYLPMPFRKHARITLTNDAGGEDNACVFYTINFTEETVDDDALYLHAHWRRTNPLPYKQDYLMVDGIKGAGQYVGTFMSWQQNNKGWWGEGEIKMYIDGDTEFPTICGTGTEDYFGGAWCFGRNFSAPFLGHQKFGMPPHGRDVGWQDSPGDRMALYRFHIQDPVFFQQDLKVTMQALGWRDGGRYLPLQDDIASVVYWYQAPPHAPFPPFPDRDAREII